MSKSELLFLTEDRIYQHNVLGHRIDLYVPKYKLAKEIDELGLCTRNIEDKLKKQKGIEKTLDCKFIRINQPRENFNFNQIIESTKKARLMIFEKNY